MVKSDLRTGMYAKTRNGKLWLIIEYDGDIVLCHPEGHSSVNNQLKYQDCNSDYDIVEIFTPKTRGGYVLKYNNAITMMNKWFTSAWKRSEETIKIGEITYDKLEFEQAVKNLKPINK